MTLAADVLEGQPRALARAISIVEAGGANSDRLLAAIGPVAPRAIRIGVTGAPGAGKSTLVECLVSAFRGRGWRVAVLAVDPSSPFSGGAILGDRVRMQGHAQDAGVFIRSMASRGQLGGIARATDDAANLLDAAGFEAILIETVGVGQAEVEIVRSADVVVVVAAPGAGDDVQALKAGIMEIADVFVVNKADRDGADRAAAAIDATLSLAEPARAWRPPVLKTVGTRGEGVEELVAAIDRFRSEAAGVVEERRGARHRRRVGRPAPIVDHIGVAVSHPERLSGILRDLFGLQTGDPEVVGDHRIRFVETEGAALELVEPMSPDSPVARFLSARGAGLHHVCLRVADIDATLADLKGRGVRLVDDTPRAGAHGSRIAFLHPASTGGILIEIKQ